MEDEKLMAPLDEEPTKIIKVCSKHGALYLKDVNKAGFYASGNPAFRCKSCMKESHRIHYLKHTEKVRTSQKKYFEENKEKVRKLKLKSNKKNAYKHLKRENYRKKMRERKASLNLEDRYIKKHIVKRTSLSIKDVPEPLIELARQSLKLKRLIRKNK